MTAAEHVRMAEQLLADRRLRDQVFGVEADGFGEPAWDMLLALFVAGDEGVKLRPLLDPLESPAASAETYARWLISRGLVSERGGVVRLRPRGAELLERYFGQMGGRHD